MPRAWMTESPHEAKPLRGCSEADTIALYPAQSVTQYAYADAVVEVKPTVPEAVKAPVKAGDVVSVRKPPVTYSFRVLACLETRVGAKLIPQVYENVTPQEEYEKLEMSRISGFVDRQRGTGRPTKKERRQLDAFTDPVMFGWDDDE